MSGRDFFAVDGRRRSSPSSVVAVVRHFPFSSKGGTFEKNQIFAVFQKLAIFLKSKIFSKMSGRDFFAVDGRSSSPSSPSSVVAVVKIFSFRHFPFSSKGGTFEKNQIFAVFQKLAIFLKSKIFSKMSGRDFFAVDGRRRSSPSSVVAVVRHFPFSSKGGTFEKNQIFAVFQKLAIFLKSKIFSKMSGRDFFAVDGRRRSSPSSVVAVVRHFPFSSKGGTFEKNQIFAVFQKLAIFLKSKIFSKMSGRDFFAVDGRRRSSSPSSLVAVVRHFPFSSKGGTFEKNQIFAVFQKLAIFLKSKIFSKMSGRDFFAVDGRRRSSPSSVVAVVRHFPFSSKGGTFEKNQIFAVFQKLAIFLKSKIFSKMSGRDFFAVDGRRRSSPSSSSSPSSVISLFRPREGPLKKIRFSLFFKNSQFF